MDLTIYLFIAILMAAATFAIGKIFGDKAKQAILYLAGLAVILPIIVIALVGMLGMLQTDPATAQEIAASTTEAIINYVAEKLPYIVISDVAGIIFGGIASLFSRRRD
jgi:hypothetical protein